MSDEYRNNHYVPRWYQKRFIDAESSDHSLYYLDLNPEIARLPTGVTFRKNELRFQGTKHCFRERDLYTRNFSGEIVTDIESAFFGKVDGFASKTVIDAARFTHNSGHGKSLIQLLDFLSIQKLRTPKGLAWLAVQARQKSREETLLHMISLRRMFCAVWTECVWQFADARSSPTKFILSDHPITIYNREYGPRSGNCRDFKDPDIRQHGSHTLFPLSPERILILTNLSWVLNPYQSAKGFRPNPHLFRDAMLKVMDIQVERNLTEIEVRQINFIIKNRAKRYIAAGRKEWLYPEDFVSRSDWSRFGNGYLLMPDPRCVSRSGPLYLGFKGGGSTAFDAFGRRPGQPGFPRHDHVENWRNLDRFQGEFARLFGPKRRGRDYEFGTLSSEVDEDWYHQYHLSLERRHTEPRRPRRQR